MNYRTHLPRTLGEIDPDAWNRLLLQASGGSASLAHCNPFMRHEFLLALEQSGSASPRTGWTPAHCILEQDGQLVAAAVLYEKSHSYGEYVFDWAWADAYQRHGLDYYPKLLSAIPFTPVCGPRLMAIHEPARRALLDAILTHARDAGRSSWHVLFPDEAEQKTLTDAGLMIRQGVQFHWTNPGWPDFDAFLDSLAQPKRKKIRAERRRVAEAGIRFRQLDGHEAGEADWRFFKRCYDATYRAHCSTPYLNLAFFLQLAQTMPDHVRLVLAERGDGPGAEPIAASLLIHTPDTLYGRYWGALDYVPCLHFETSYYQPIEFCIARGIRCFEGGAQGEHKMARGFLPVRTQSAHWLGHPAFADAVERFLAREGDGMDRYLDELDERTPFKAKASQPGVTAADPATPAR